MGTWWTNRQRQKGREHEYLRCCSWHRRRLCAWREWEGWRWGRWLFVRCRTCQTEITNHPSGLIIGDDDLDLEMSRCLWCSFLLLESLRDSGEFGTIANASDVHDDPCKRKVTHVRQALSRESLAWITPWNGWPVRSFTWFGRLSTLLSPSHSLSQSQLPLSNVILAESLPDTSKKKHDP